MDFLLLLRDELREGLGRTAEEYRARHASWILAQQRAEGGFANRRGQSDLYYTAFAVRSLSALGVLTPESAARAAAYLLAIARAPDRVRLRQPSGAFCDTVHAASWWDALTLCADSGGDPLSAAERGEFKALTLARLAEMRRPDGGYAKTPVEADGSLYHTFIAAALHAQLGEVVPDEKSALAFLRSLARPEGGFIENRHSKRPGTNGTAAGLFLGMLLAQFDGQRPHLEFIASMRGSEGGFEAAPSAPLADLLSTYTALLALKLGGALERKTIARARAYARGLEAPDGGYTGFALESVVDCEYTFYGLGVESIDL